MRLPLLLLCAALATACTTRQQCLTFIHFNDVHDRTEPADGAFSACNATRAPCYGGLARMATVIANASADARARGCIPVVLDAGDQMTGTLWDGVYHGLDSVVWQNMVGVQVGLLMTGVCGYCGQTFVFYNASYAQFLTKLSHTHTHNSSPGYDDWQPRL